MAFKKKETKKTRVIKQHAKKAKRLAKRIGRQAHGFYERRGIVLISKAIDWAEREGHITKEKAEFFREQIRTGKINDFLTGFKAHVLLSSIPVVSIAGSPLRAGYTIGARLKTRIKLKRKKISEEEFKRAMQLHSHAAIAFSAVPFIGFLAYVLSNSIREPELMGIVANYLLFKYIKTPLYKVKVGIQWMGSPKRPYLRFSVYAGRRLLKVIRKPSTKPRE